MIKFIRDVLRGRLFGHPIHMMLVHFPASLFPISLIADLAAIFFNENTFYIFSFYTAVSGVAIGFFALIFGIIDLMKIPPHHKAFNTGLLHGGLNFLWLTIFSVLIGLEMKNYPLITFSSFKLITKIIVVAGLLFSNYLGGELVLKYDIGKKIKSY